MFGSLKLYSLLKIQFLKYSLGFLNKKLYICNVVNFAVQFAILTYFPSQVD